MDLPHEPRPALARRSRPGRLGRLSRGLSGALAAGLVVLTVVLLLAQYAAAEHGNAGPGPAMVFGHAGVAVVAVALQFLADRHDGRVGTAACAGGLVVTLGALWWFWWL